MLGIEKQATIVNDSLSESIGPIVINLFAFVHIITLFAIRYPNLNHPSLKEY
jgi:hypothetical protein